MEPEYAPLFPPGFLEISLDDLDRLFVEPFDIPAGRRKLVTSLREVVALLQEIGLECEVWIDGSFATHKPDPSDMDVVICSDDVSRSRLTVSQGTKFDKLIKKKDLTRYRYNCDLSYCDRGDSGQKIYWRGCFGFSRTDQPKGIPLLRLTGSC